jgi:protocatechuate 3,4-dioxygenase, alpha subunit
MSSHATASQTVGPYFQLGLEKLYKDNLTGPGEKIRIRGYVLDGDGKGVNDAMLEIWQADSRGRYVHLEDQRTKSSETGFRRFGRVPTNENGGFEIKTIKPGRVPGPGGLAQAPHIVVSVFARGLLKQLITRIYFSEESANPEDAVLKLVPSERRATLLARIVAGARGQFEWDVVLQGEDETVFFDW